MSFLAALGFGLAVGGSLIVGALAGVLLPLWERVGAVAIVFGGGILLGALAFELVPEAEAQAGVGLTAVGLMAGAGVFALIDWILTRDEGRRDLRRTLQAAATGRRMDADPGEGGRGKTIALGIFVDGVPETAAIGVTVAEGEVGLALLAGVVVGNLVESYGATQAMLEGGGKRRSPVGVFAAIGLALLAALLVGATLLSGLDERVIGIAEALAGGAIFAAVLIAIVPHAFAEVSQWAPVAAMVGLLTGYLLA